MNSIALLKSHLSHAGGAEKYTLRMAHALKEKGFAVTLLTSGKERQVEGINVINSSSPSPSFRAVRQFDRFCSSYLKNHPHEVVFGLDRNSHQTHLRASNGVHAAFLKHRKKQEGFFKSLSFLCNPLHRTLLNIERKSFENPELQCLITNSHMVKREILENYRVDSRKIKVVHNGVEWKEFEKPFLEWPHSQPPKNQFHLLFIGHNYRRKGLFPLLKGLSSLPKEAPVHLSVVGKDKEIQIFQKFITSLGIGHKVTLFGPQNTIIPFLQKADALIIPSFYDPFANVTVEALAMGVQVISSKTNGGHEILTPSNGIVIDALDDQEAMQEALEKALKRPKTWESSLKIRESVAHLDFGVQLPALFSEAYL